MAEEGVLRVGYVPEHFSVPLLQLSKTPWGQKHLNLVAQPSGTGQMLTSFNGEEPSKRTIDVAIALTEALIAGLAKGRSDYELIGTYVKSSLNWAVITGTDAKAAKYRSIDDLRGTKIGISRIGSGSQIMASVMALQHGWLNTDEGQQQIDFKDKVNDTFANLRKGVNQLPELETSAFMWEWFTTKPYVDNGEVRFIGNVPTPWPSWTIAASKSVQQPDLLQEFQGRLQESILSFTSPSNEVESLKVIEDHFEYKAEDVRQWWSGVRWVQDQRPPLQNGQGTQQGATAIPLKLKGQNTSTTVVSKEVLLETLEVLQKAGVVQSPTEGWKLETFASSTRISE